MEWNMQQPQEQVDEGLNVGGNTGGIMQQPQEQVEEGPTVGGNNGGMLMTDEQMNVLQKQIAAYASICMQLEELHRSLTCPGDSQIDSGMWTPYSNAWMGFSGHRISHRHRWSPKPEQLNALERFFEEEDQHPHNNKHQEIATDLAKYGPISAKNVQTWFQNRRARLKKKNLVAEISKNNAIQPDSPIVLESTDVKNGPLPHNLKTQNGVLCIQNGEVSTQALSVDPPGTSSEPSENIGLMSFSEGMSRMNHLLEKMDGKESYNPYSYAENCTIKGDTWWPNVS